MAAEFQVNLSGNLVEVLDKQTKKLDGHAEGTKHAEKALVGLETELGKVGGSIRGVGVDLEALHHGGSLFTFDIAEGATSILETFAKLGEVVFELAEKFVDLAKEIVGAAGAAEDLNLAVKLDVGVEGGEEVEKLVASFKGTRFNDKTLKNALLPILEESGDEHREQFDSLLTAATDVATRRNTGGAGAAAALGALRSIEIMPQKLRGSLTELGIKQKDYYSDLGDLMGISAETAEKQTKAGKIKAQTLLSVALNQIAEREGGALGNATNEGSKTLGSTLARLGQLKENLFEKLAESPGMKSVQHVLDHFLALMEGDAGDKLLQRIDLVIKSLADVLTDDTIDGFINKVMGFVEDLTGPTGINTVTNGFKGVLAVVEGVGSAMSAIVRSVERMTSGMQSLLGLTETGRSMMGQGQEDKVASVKGQLASKVNQVASSGLSDDESLGLKYRIAQQFGMKTEDITHMVDALNGGNAELDRNLSRTVPKMAKGGVVSRPTLAMIGEAGPEAVVPLGKMGGDGPSMGELHLHFSGDIDPADGDEFGRRIVVELKKFFESSGAALGARV